VCYEILARDKQGSVVVNLEGQWQTLGGHSAMRGALLWTSGTTRSVSDTTILSNIRR
jgi:hypothetical protein